MRVALVNNNTAVSRLITLSLNKISAQYVESDELEVFEGKFDVVVLDNDAGVSIDDASLIAPLLIYLVPRGGDHPKTANAVLEKPFLPTEFITAFNDITSGLDIASELENEDEVVNAVGDESDGFADFEDIKGIDDLDELSSADFIQSDTDSLDSLDDLGDLDEIFTDHDLQTEEEIGDGANKEEVDEILNDDLTNVDTIDEKIDEKMQTQDSAEAFVDEGNLVEELDEIKLNSDDEINLADAGLGELSSLVDEIESMEVLDLDEIGADEPVQISEIEIEQAQSVDDGELEELLDEMELAEGDSIGEILASSDTDAAGVLDDVDAVDSEVAAFESDALDNESDFDEIDLDSTQADADESLTNELDMIDEGLINMLGNCDESNECCGIEKECCKSGSLDDISQDDMLIAMGLSDEIADEPVANVEEIAQVDDEPLFDLDKTKETIGAKVASEVKKALSQSELREVLKGMKISVDISFEDDK